MPYIKNTYYVGNSIEVEKVHSGRYGKRVPVSEKYRPTSESAQKVNYRNKVKKLRRLIMNNFTEDDYHLVLTYRKENRPDLRTAKELLKSFHGKMKRRYAKAGIEYKWICVTEYRTAAIHHHLIIPDAPELVKLLKESWPHGHINLTPIYGDMEVEGLAEYFLKETRDTRQKATYAKKHSESGENLTQPPSIYQKHKCVTSGKGNGGYWSKGLEKRAKASKGILHRQRISYGRSK